MKNIMIIAVLLCTAAISAQSNKTTFEKDGDLVKATYFHANGEIAQVGQFLEGKLHGEWKMYNEAGKKIAMGEYMRGKKTGKWFFWQNEALNEVDFQNSKIVSVTQWDNKNPVVVNK